MKLALFDFCNTIVDFSTADAYIQYVLDHLSEEERKRRTKKHELFRNLKIVWVHDLFVSRKILKNRVYLNKCLYLESIAGITYEVMNEYAKAYYKERIRPHLIKPTISELELKMREGFRIAIISGGYDLYLRYFAEEYGIHDLICTHIEFYNHRATGKIDGIDCMDNRKVTLLEAHYDGIDIDQDSSFVYSDSRSDLPILTWAGNGVVVARKKVPDWAKKNGLRYLIWEE
jgi:HAD superfamily hydrolase (TIGR01490 family)